MDVETDAERPDPDETPVQDAGRRDAAGIEAPKPAPPSTSADPTRASAGSADDAVADTHAKLVDRVQKGEVEFSDVVRLTQLARDTDDPGHAIGLKFADEAREKFKRNHGGDETRVAVFGGTGVYLTPGGTFRWVILRSIITFDISEAHPLIYDIDAVAEQAREWWPEELSDNVAGGEHGELPAEEKRTRRRLSIRVRRASSVQSALRPHLDRAYMITTQVLSALAEENARQRKALKDSPDKEPKPSDGYAKSLASARNELRRSQELLQTAAQRDAQVRYGAGMIWGIAALTVLCAVLGAIFLWRDVPAYYAVAIPAGGIGAVVSVLQRMTSGRLTLDVHAGRQMLVAYGAVRPLIGAVFGMVAFVLIAGGLLPAINVSEDAPLAFYAGLGFLAGFNERFAQDMLAGASMQSSPAGSTRAK